MSNPQIHPRRHVVAPSRRRALLALVVAAMALPVAASASDVEIPHTFSSGDSISAAEFNANFDAIADAINDNDARLALLEGGAGAAVGVIAFFDAASCPAGWAEFDDLRGRVPLGLPAGGTVSATVGAELSDTETILIDEVPAHVHPVNPPTTASGNGTNHTHTINPPSTATTTDGDHVHSIRVENDNGYSSSYVRGAGNASGGATATSPIGLEGEHNHDVDIDPFASGSASAHTHTVDITTFNSGSTGVPSVDVTMPYVQLIACEKL